LFLLLSREHSVLIYKQNVLWRVVKTTLYNILKQNVLWRVVKTTLYNILKQNVLWRVVKTTLYNILKQNVLWGGCFYYSPENILF
jgi:hypothetical protein